MLPLEGQVDAAALPPPRAQGLRELVQIANLRALPEDSTVDAPGDRFKYELTIEDDDGTRTVRTSDAAVPPALQELLRFVLDEVRRVPISRVLDAERSAGEKTTDEPGGRP